MYWLYVVRFHFVFVCFIVFITRGQYRGWKESKLRGAIDFLCQVLQPGCNWPFKLANVSSCDLNVNFQFVNSLNQYSFIFNVGLWPLILFTIYWDIVCLEPYFHVHWSLLCWTNTHCEPLSSTCLFSFFFFNWPWIFYTSLNTRHCWCPNFYWCRLIIIMCIFYWCLVSTLQGKDHCVEMRIINMYLFSE